jgi:hypothetical protein
VPLFPSYVFCKFDGTDRWPLLTIPGVRSVVDFGEAIEAEREIENLRLVVNSGLKYEPCPFRDTGVLATVEDGFLRGLSGVALGTDGSRLVIIPITLIRRSVAVEIEQHCTLSFRTASGFVRSTPARSSALRRRLK